MKVGLAAAGGATLILALGAAVFALRDTPDKEFVGEEFVGEEFVGGIPVEASAVPTPEVGLVGPGRTPPVVAPVPDEPVENVVGAGSVLSDSDDRQWNDGGANDTGPFIDADDDAVDYSFAPVSEVGDFIDPDED